MTLAPFCDTVTESSDPARACSPGTPYVSHRCGCYIDIKRYEAFYNATSVDHCRRLAGISGYGTPLVGPTQQYVSIIRLCFMLIDKEEENGLLHVDLERSLPNAIVQTIEINKK